MLQRFTVLHPLLSLLLYMLAGGDAWPPGLEMGFCHELARTFLHRNLSVTHDVSHLRNIKKKTKIE
jgi:hypothetical protein